MASHRSGRDGKLRNSDGKVSDSDLLLHPELLSQDFIKLVLHERNIKTEVYEDRDHLTELYIQHVIPLPQRELPNSRWGKRMQKTKARQSSSSNSSSTDNGRKRPLIVFDGSSTKIGSIKLKRTDDASVSAAADRLKPPPSNINLANPIRKLSGSTTNCSPSSSAVSSTRATASSSGSNAQSSTGNSSTSSSSASSPGNSSNTNTKLKRGPSGDGVPLSPEIKSPEAKKKIQHVTWP